MKKCENCGIEHNGSYGSGRFCSSKCARSFSTKVKRKEINEKLSKNNTGKNFPNRKKQTKKSFIKIKEKLKKTWDDKLLAADFSTLKYDSLRRRVILEQDEKCNKCELNEWLGHELVLEFEHKDGNHLNNKRENLEALCPNCHSLTPTWRGRNKKNNKLKVSDEKLFEALIDNNFNMRQALLEVGLAAKGGNYCRCHKLKREYEEMVN